LKCIEKIKTFRFFIRCLPFKIQLLSSGLAKNHGGMERFENHRANEPI